MRILEWLIPEKQAPKPEVDPNTRGLDSVSLIDEIMASAPPSLDLKEKTHSTAPSLEEKILTNNERKSSKELGGGCSKVFLVSLENDGSAIFKPEEGAYTVRGKNGTGFKRERAAYLVDRFFGINLVPPTVVREIDGNIGSVQRFIADARTGYQISYNEKRTHSAFRVEEIIRMRVFDYIISNSDRHDGNYLVKDGKLYAIDHGLSFFTESYGVGHLSNHEGKTIPEDIKRKVQELLNSEYLKSIFTELMTELLDKEEVAALMKRLEKFARTFSNNSIITLETLEALK